MKLSYLFAAILVLTSCAPTVSEAPIEEKPTVQTEARTSLPLPEFPNYLTSKSKLDASDSGDIYYPIKSPYDFTRVLNGYDELPTHTGKGTLVLPEGASADSPVPAMVILHGSGAHQENHGTGCAAIRAAYGYLWSVPSNHRA